MQEIDYKPIEEESQKITIIIIIIIISTSFLHALQKY